MKMTQTVRQGGPADDQSGRYNLFLLLANVRETGIFIFIVLLVILVMLDSVRRARMSGIGWKDRVYHIRGGMLRH